MEEAGFAGLVSGLRQGLSGSFPRGVAFMGEESLGRLGSGTGLGSREAASLLSVGFGEVPEELDSERARTARGWVRAEFRAHPSPAAPGAGVRGGTAGLAEVEGRRAAPGRGRPHGSQ